MPESLSPHSRPAVPSSPSRLPTLCLKGTSPCSPHYRIYSQRNRLCGIFLPAVAISLCTLMDYHVEMGPKGSERAAKQPSIAKLDEGRGPAGGTKRKRSPFYACHAPSSMLKVQSSYPRGEKDGVDRVAGQSARIDEKSFSEDRAPGGIPTPKPERRTEAARGATGTNSCTAPIDTILLPGLLSFHSFWTLSHVGTWLISLGGMCGSGDGLRERGQEGFAWTSDGGCNTDLLGYVRLFPTPT